MPRLASLTWLAGATGEAVTQRAPTDRAVTHPTMTPQVPEGRDLVAGGPHLRNARASPLTPEGRVLANRAVAYDTGFLATLGEGTPAGAAGRGGRVGARR